MTTTQIEHENVTLIREGFAAFAKGDMQTLSEIFAPRADWHIAPCGVLAGHYRGRAAVLAFFEQLQRETGGTFRSVPHRFLAEKNQVVVPITISGSRKGRSLNEKGVLIFTTREGAVHHVEDYSLDYPSAEAFWR